MGVVTNIGGDHVAAYGSLDGVAAEKSKLIKSLPPSGVAVLNADDPRVLAMQSQFSGRTITYGMSPDAMLQGSVCKCLMAGPFVLYSQMEWTICSGPNTAVRQSLGARGVSCFGVGSCVRGPASRRSRSC